ncbi:retinol dehydrogenase 12-like [Corticium candelabrum]|uniref:retinol dehydrogenase 12-like n=1 Tax=Corticium candelabrum TaxID=121492 RepID=UPI002E257154|nr:retinol dehydrogenase 12-like [Corticium candelabrum]
MSSSSLFYPAAAVGLTVIGLVALRRYSAGGVCRSKKKLDGKTVIITGANTGIGLETTIDLACRNARVVMACRSEERGRRACTEAKQRSNSNNIVFYQLDLADLESVRRFAAEVLKHEPRIDILLNNAGLMMCPYSKTKDGFETQFGVNHLGHFLLTHLLLERIKECAPARIINVSSFLYAYGNINFDDLMSEKSYSDFGAYAQSKLANILFTRVLADRLEGTDVTTYSLHPGSVNSELNRHLTSSLLTRIAYYLVYPFYWLTSKTTWEGAQTNIYCAVSEDLEGVSGRYYKDCAEAKLLPLARDDAVAKKLWDVSEKLIGLSGRDE